MYRRRKKDEQYKSDVLAPILRSVIIKHIRGHANISEDLRKIRLNMSNQLYMNQNKRNNTFWS